MADTKTKIVKLKVELDDRGLVKYVSEVKEAGRETDNLGKNRGWKQLNSDLGAIATKATIAVAGLTGFLKGADALSQVGQAALRSRGALEALTGSTEEYERKVRAVQDATRGLTTESEAAAIAARLQQFGLAETATEMQSFVDTIVRVGAVNPMLGDTTEAINQIQLTLSNMSFMRLDQLGLSSGAVRKRMAELKQETKGLSNEMAFQTAVMEGLAAQADRVSESMLNIGNPQGRLKTAIREAGDDIGIYITGRLDEAIIAAEQLGFIIGQIGIYSTGVALADQLTGLAPNVTQQQEVTYGGARYAVGSQINQEMLHYVTGPNGEIIDQNAFNLMMSQGALTLIGAQGINPGVMNRQEYYNRAEISAAQLGRGWSETSGPPLDASMLSVTSALDLQARMQARATGPDLGLQRRTLPTTGAGFEAWQAATQAMGLARNQMSDFGQNDLPGLVEGIQGLAGAFIGAADAAGDFATEAEAVGSLNELFGVAPSGLSADVYQRAADALRNADVEGEAYAEAIRVLGIETGVTNVANETYNERLNHLAEAYAAGTISAADFVEQTRALQNQDWSKIQAVADSLDPEKAAAFTEALSAPGGQEAFDTAFSKMQALSDIITGAGKEGEGDLGAFAGLETQAQAMEDSQIDRNKRMTDDAAETWGAVSTAGTTAYEDIEKRSERAFAAMKANIASMNYTVEVKTHLMMGESTPGPAPQATQKGHGFSESVPQYAEGGITPPGGPTLALVHPNEAIIPLDKLGKSGGFSSRIPQMTTAGLQNTRFEAETPIVLQIGDDEVARINARNAYRSNTAGAVRAN